MRDDDDKIVSLCDIIIARKIIKKRQLYERIGADPELAKKGANAYYSLETDNPKLIVNDIEYHYRELKCPHCLLEGTKEHMKTYHMQNCRHRKPLRGVDTKVKGS